VGHAQSAYRKCGNAAIYFLIVSKVLLISAFVDGS